MAVSLTSQLQQGVLARWCTRRLPGTGVVVDQVRAAAATAVVSRPAGRVGAGHWSTVGAVVGARLSALVQAAAPYAALYGLVGAGVVSARASNAIAATYPAQQAVIAAEPDLAAVAVGLRPSPSDVVALFAPPPPGTGPDRSGPAVGDDGFGELAARGQLFHREHAPTATIGSHGAEVGLARTYAAWTLGEDRYRSGTTPPALAELAAGGAVTVAGLRELAPEAVVADAAALARLVETSGTLTAWHDWAHQQAPARAGGLGFAAPVLVPHWAEADLLVGDTLVEVKTVVRADAPARVARWCWQLLGYAWLDPGRRWRIEQVGLYLARHGVTVRWALEQFETLLVGDPARVPAVRAQFQRLAERVAVGEGATLLPPP
ncbi:hypothetical protein [Pseudonocardia sp. NPDC049635]|uniref:hypothetical protein n=1 Tax=Pseudonocardia sp. NPDC049635 TaxID=3155506 RepID=UPI0034085DD9